MKKPMEPSFSYKNNHLQNLSRVLGPLNIRSLYWQILQKLYSSISISWVQFNTNIMFDT